MTMNSKHRAVKLTFGLTAALLAGCAHHNAAPTTAEVLGTDSAAAPEATATATPTPTAAATAEPTAMAAATPAPTTAPSAAEATATATPAPTAVTSQPPVVPAQTDVPENNPHGERYDAEDAARSTGLFAQSQAATAAKSDAMLYDRSFDGSTLNSLGQVKLDLILKATPSGQPVVVYLNVPHDSLTDRQTTVAAFLKNAGVADGMIKLVEGPNTNNATPTAYNLSAVYKAEGNSYAGEAADGEVPSAAPATK